MWLDVCLWWTQLPPPPIYGYSSAMHRSKNSPDIYPVQREKAPKSLLSHSRTRFAHHHTLLPSPTLYCYSLLGLDQFNYPKHKKSTVREIFETRIKASGFREHPESVNVNTTGLAFRLALVEVIRRSRKSIRLISVQLHGILQNS